MEEENGMEEGREEEGKGVLKEEEVEEESGGPFD